MAKTKADSGKIEELESDIKELKSSINDPDISEEDKAGLKETLVGMEAELEELKKPKVKKPKKEKAPKPEVKFNGKGWKEVSSQELETAWGKRVEQIKETGGKVKTKSIFSPNGETPSPASEATMTAVEE